MSLKYTLKFHTICKFLTYTQKFHTISKFVSGLKDYITHLH